MYREPTEASKSNSIKDASAVARSAIRRQASVRGRPGSRLRPHVHGVSHHLPLARSITEEIEREGDGLGSRVRSPLLNNNPVDEPPGSDPARREAGQRILNDVISHHHPGRRLRIPRGSALNDLRSLFFPSEGSEGPQNTEGLPFTPRFAPAIAFHSTISAHPPPPYVSRSSPFPPLDGPTDDPGPHVPLLRRVGERSVNEALRPNREPVVDGLGDRQRSLSPEYHRGDDDAWETLLTTITPDVNRPSADSSFNSASASGTNAPRNGTTTNSSNNSQTLPSSLDSAVPTMHMVLDPYPEFLNPCDYPDSDSETEPESESTQRFLSRNSRNSRLRRAARRSHGLPFPSNPPPIPTASVTFSNPPSYQDTQQHLQSIMDRLVQRENLNLPEFLLATAGLPHVHDRRTGTNDGALETDGPDGPTRQRA
ncbi:hypothetical protein PHISCL_07509 [Aspergillus sclerotialis]|uniref:Uncharacterized protein n=1 Tax=Aspergillus sclerotialis TaxID=2070753 RepID=A0A3A2ZC06_9EURO|nr:hypothetical protein PHISCL_07509 [Aspergillus sclerotialis]